MTMEISASSKQAVPFYAVIVAGGSGTRLGGEVPKQYQKIGGKAILHHTLEKFINCPGLKDIRVVIGPDHQPLYDDAVHGLTLPPPVIGGSERKDSVFNGLQDFANLDYESVIVIHDAARPLVKTAHITVLAKTAQEKKAATLAVAVADTQKYRQGDYLDRQDLYAIQTPQGFHYGLLLKAHETADEKHIYTDDTSLVAAQGQEISFVAGSRENIKITTEEDMELAEKLLSPALYETRTGLGYDVHAFTDGDKIRLCGIDIPHNKSLKGHSDADVGLHALTDALLGTVGAGDIGSHFPPSDPQWKNADSKLFLEKAVALVSDKGGRISNLDLTLICESPKIGPHREAMQQNIAAICRLPPERVSIKATTTEKLGFTGRGEGIAAQAIAAVRFPLQEK